MPAGIGERRFFVIDVPEKHKEDHPYFKKIIDQMENGGIEAMLYDLLQLDISDVNLREIEKTEELFDQIVQNMDIVGKYWFERLYEGTMSKDRDD